MPRLSRLLSIACLSLVLPLAGQAQTIQFQADFESPLYTLGPVGDTYLLPTSGQQGWLAAPRAPYATAPSPWVNVSNLRAAGGTQSLQLLMDNSYFNGINGYGASAWRDFGLQPLALNSPTDALSVSMSLYLEQSASSDLPWQLTLSTFNCCGLNVTILPNDQVGYAHNLMNTGITFTPGFSLHNTWIRLTLERDPIDYTLLRLTLNNGSQQWQQQLSSPGSSMPYVVFGGAMPNIPTALTRGTAYVDDVLIGYNLPMVPEPASAGLMLAGIAALVARQRRG